MIVKLDQKTNHAKWEMHEFQRMHYMNPFWSYSILMALVEHGFSFWLNTLVMLKNTKKGHALLPQVYLQVVKFI